MPAPATPAQNASGTGYSAEGYAPGSSVSSQYVPGQIKIPGTGVSPVPKPSTNQEEDTYEQAQSIFNPANSIFASNTPSITELINNKANTVTLPAGNQQLTTFNLGGQNLNATQALAYAQQNGLTAQQYQLYGAALNQAAIVASQPPQLTAAQTGAFPGGIHPSGGEGGGGAAVAATGGNQSTQNIAQGGASTVTSVPLNAQLATATTGNAKYVSPSGAVTYYNIPSTGTSGILGESLSPTQAIPVQGGQQIDYATFANGAKIQITGNQFSGSYVNNGQTYNFSGSLPTTALKSPITANNDALDIAYSAITQVTPQNPPPGNKGLVPIYINLDQFGISNNAVSGGGYFSSQAGSQVGQVVNNSVNFQQIGIPYVNFTNNPGPITIPSINIVSTVRTDGSALPIGFTNPTTGNTVQNLEINGYDFSVDNSGNITYSQGNKPKQDATPAILKALEEANAGALVGNVLYSQGGLTNQLQYFRLSAPSGFPPSGLTTVSGQVQGQPRITPTALQDVTRQNVNPANLTLPTQFQNPQINPAINALLSPQPSQNPTLASAIPNLNIAGLGIQNQQAGTSRLQPNLTQPPLFAYQNLSKTGILGQTQQASNTISSLSPIINNISSVINNLASDIEKWFPTTGQKLIQQSDNINSQWNYLTQLEQSGQVSPQQAIPIRVQLVSDYILGGIGLISSRLPVVGNLANFDAGIPFIKNQIQSQNPEQRLNGLIDLTALAAAETRLLLAGLTYGVSPNALGGAIAARIATVAALGGTIGGTLNPTLNYFLNNQTQPKQIAGNILSGAASGATYAGLIGGVEEILPIQQGIEDLGNLYLQLAAKAGYGALTGVGLANTASFALTGQPASLQNDILSGGIGAGLSVAPDILGKINPITLEKASYQENPYSEGTTSYKFGIKVPDIVQDFANIFLNRDISSANLEELYNSLQEQNGGVKPTTEQIMQAIVDNPDILDEHNLPSNPFRYQKTLFSLTLGPVNTATTEEGLTSGQVSEAIRSNLNLRPDLAPKEYYEQIKQLQNPITTESTSPLGIRFNLGNPEVPSSYYIPERNIEAILTNRPIPDSIFKNPSDVATFQEALDRESIGNPNNLEADVLRKYTDLFYTLKNSNLAPLKDLNIDIEGHPLESQAMEEVLTKPDNQGKVLIEGSNVGSIAFRDFRGSGDVDTVAMGGDNSANAERIVQEIVDRTNELYGSEKYELIAEKDGSFTAQRIGNNPELMDHITTMKPQGETSPDEENYNEEFRRPLGVPETGKYLEAEGVEALQPSELLGRKIATAVAPRQFNEDSLPTDISPGLQPIIDYLRENVGNGGTFVGSLGRGTDTGDTLFPNKDVGDSLVLAKDLSDRYYGGQLNDKILSIAQDQVTRGFITQAGYDALANDPITELEDRQGITADTLNGFNQAIQNNIVIPSSTNINTVIPESIKETNQIPSTQMANTGIGTNINPASVKIGQVSTPTPYNPTDPLSVATQQALYAQYLKSSPQGQKDILNILYGSPGSQIVSPSSSLFSLLGSNPQYSGYINSIISNYINSPSLLSQSALASLVSSGYLTPNQYYNIINGQYPYQGYSDYNSQYPSIYNSSYSSQYPSLSQYPSQYNLQYSSQYPYTSQYNSPYGSAYNYTDQYPYTSQYNSQYGYPYPYTYPYIYNYNKPIPSRAILDNIFNRYKGFPSNQGNLYNQVYAPSLAAILFGIKASKIPYVQQSTRTVSPLGIRPVIEPEQIQNRQS